MDEALDAIMLLLKCDEPVTLKTDWFELREARLHLAPYTEPHLEIAVAERDDAGGRNRGGVGTGWACSRSAPDSRADRTRWPVSGKSRGDRGQARQEDGPQEVAPRRERARRRRRRRRRLRHVKKAERHETVTYFEETLGRPPGRMDDPLTEGVKMGTTLVGSADTVVPHRESAADERRRLRGLLFRAHEWRPAKQTLRSYELSPAT